MCNFLYICTIIKAIRDDALKETKKERGKSAKYFMARSVTSTPSLNGVYVFVEVLRMTFVVYHVFVLNEVKGNYFNHCIFIINLNHGSIREIEEFNYLAI